MSVNQDLRNELVLILEQKGITNKNVLDAIRSVPRHMFIPPALHKQAYMDTAVQIAAHQTISQPYTVAFMTQALAPHKDMKVLEIGTGSGYQSAILSVMGCKVFSIERIYELHIAARSLLNKLKYQATLKWGDGTLGWDEFQPYDGIIVTAGAPDVPKALLEQLSEGGRLVIPIGDRVNQSLQIYHRQNEAIHTTTIEGFRFVPLIGKNGWS